MPRDLPLVKLCGSRTLMEQFAAFVREVAPGCASQPFLQHGESLWGFSAAGVHAKLIITALYKDCTVALSRKEDRARKAMLWERRIQDLSHLTLGMIEAARTLHGDWDKVAEALGVRSVGSLRQRLYRLRKVAVDPLFASGVL